jgi:methyl-accepting chemotaxis protein
VPLVDEVVQHVGGTCTLFQRLDDEGSMLRVATTVRTPEGTRAVGTYLPVRAADGTPSPVLAAVLAGRTYVGEAQVLSTWFHTAYAPVHGPDGSVVGVLYVGLPRDP